MFPTISCPSWSFRSRKKVGNSNPEVTEARAPAEPRGSHTPSPTRTTRMSSLRSWCARTLRCIVRKVENVGAVVYAAGTPPGLASPTYEHEESHIVLDFHTTGVRSHQSKPRTHKDLNEKTQSASRANAVMSSSGMRLPRRRRKARGSLLLREEAVLCGKFQEEVDKLGSRLQTIDEHGPFVPIHSGTPVSTAAAAVASAARRGTGGLFKSYRNLNRVSSTRLAGTDGNSRRDARATFHFYHSPNGEAQSAVPLYHPSTA